MATQKTTTKAKTKTTKTVKSRAAGTRTAKSVSKTTAKAKAKKAAVKTSASKVSKKVSTTPINFRSMGLFSALLFAALAVLAGVLMNAAAFDLSVGYLTKDVLLSDATNITAFVPGSQAILAVELRWVVVTILGLSAVFSFLYATKLRPRYDRDMGAGVVPLRWLDMAITSALIVETVAVLSGVHNLLTLKLVAGLVIVTAMLGWIAEKRNQQAGRAVWSEYVVGLVTGILPGLLIAAYALSTYVYGLVRYPWYVYALYVVAAAGYLLMAWTQSRRIRRLADNLAIERDYLYINLALKAAFATILILGFQR